MNWVPNIFSATFWKRSWQQLKLSFRLFRDPRVPMLNKGLLLLVGLYLLVPFDIIPEYLPILGQIDDLALVIIGLTAFIRMAPAEIVNEYKRTLGLDLV